MTAAADFPPLPADVLAELAALPNGSDVPAQRAWLLASDPRFARAVLHAERQGLLPRASAELWLWLVHLCVDGGSRAGTTGEVYARIVARWMRWCAAQGVDFRTVTITEFDRWKRWLVIELRNGQRHIQRQVFALRNFYDWRRSRGLAEENIAVEWSSAKPKEKPAKKYTDDQLRELFRAIGRAREDRRIRDKSAVLLLMSTGIRREELATLKLEQLELNQRTAVVRIHGKGAKERDVSFEGPAVEALKEWLAHRDSIPGVDGDSVFVSTHGASLGQPLSLRSFEVMVAVHAKEAKLRDWGIHRFRVTFATQLYDDGVDIETIRALMGHETIETTRRYLAVSERARRTRLSADRQHRVLGTKKTGAPLWARLAAGELTRA